MPLFYRHLPHLLPRMLRNPAVRADHPLIRLVDFHSSAARQLVRSDAWRQRPATTNAADSEAAAATPLLPLTQVHAHDVVQKLNAAEREALRQALNQFETDSVATKLEGELPIALCG